MFKKVKEELYEYYLNGDEERCKAFADKCFAIMAKVEKSGIAENCSAVPLYVYIIRLTAFP